MNRIITRGFGYLHKIITRGFGGILAKPPPGDLCRKGTVVALEPVGGFVTETGALGIAAAIDFVSGQVAVIENSNGQVVALEGVAGRMEKC